MQIALFGGRFDPVHNGHVAIANEVLKAVPSVDEVWMVPDYKHHWNPTVASFEDRMEMLQLIVEDHSLNANGRIKVSNIGKLVSENREGMTVTIDVIRALQKSPEFQKEMGSLIPQYRNGGANTYIFIAGSDQLPRLHEWHEYKELHMRLPFLIFPRKGYQTEGNLPDGCFWLSDTQFEPMDDSATRVRHLLQEGKSISHLVLEKVAAYIREKGLYK